LYYQKETKNENMVTAGRRKELGGRDRDIIQITLNIPYL
jgi:hypothetical protein